MSVKNQSPGSDDAAKSPKGDLGPLSAESTVELLQLAKDGNQEALDRLFQRCIPALRRWARGRLPQSARGMLETSDVVQDAVVSAMRHLEAFESRHQGALLAYLREAVMNRIRDVIRQHQRRPASADLPDDLIDEATSALERAIGAEEMARYETALQKLKASDREAIIGRLEMQYSYEELAVALNKPTPDAARVAVTRAMKRLAEVMQDA